MDLVNMQVRRGGGWGRRVQCPSLDAPSLPLSSPPSAQLRALSPPAPPSLSLSNPFFCAVQSRHLILWWMHLTVRTSKGQTAASRR